MITVKCLINLTLYVTRSGEDLSTLELPCCEELDSGKKLVRPILNGNSPKNCDYPFCFQTNDL